MVVKHVMLLQLTFVIVQNNESVESKSLIQIFHAHIILYSLSNPIQSLFTIMDGCIFLVLVLLMTLQKL